jgi:hypothetical protein
MRASAWDFMPYRDKRPGRPQVLAGEVSETPTVPFPFTSVVLGCVWLQAMHGTLFSIARFLWKLLLHGRPAFHGGNEVPSSIIVVWLLEDSLASLSFQ